ncbi:hypothetical protein FRB96_002021 [Tulasnella sp. 330]|nr:hypothetical protein FRB96_002021 [Tulasnella sp. 330]
MSALSFRSNLILSPADVVALPEDTTVPVDVSWFMPNIKRNPAEEFVAKRIPKAQRMDLDVVASKHPLGLPHMMPDARTFSEACGESMGQGTALTLRDDSLTLERRAELIGIEPTTHVVLPPALSVPVAPASASRDSPRLGQGAVTRRSRIYDTTGVFSSPRALFMFKAFGHQKASILNGGLPRWEHEGKPFESGNLKPVKRTAYPPPTLDENLVRSYEQMVINAKEVKPDAEVVLDARAHGRFTGKDPEPRPDLRSGHIPNSYSLPFSDCVRPQTSESGASYTVMKSPEELREAAGKALGSNLDSVLSHQRQVVNTCGSGMTAAVLWLTLQQLGVDSAIYDEIHEDIANWTEARIRGATVSAHIFADPFPVDLMAREKLLSGHTTSSAPAVITIHHHQLKDLIVCPSERGIISYVSGKLIVSHDIRKSYKPPSPLANLDFEPNCLSSGCGLIVAGGGLAELFVGAMPASPTDSAPQLSWSQTKQLQYPASINNSLLVTNNNLIPSYSPASASSLALGASPAAALEPRLFVSNNDERVKVFSVATRSTIQGDRVMPAGVLKLHTPVNHTSISPDGRTLLAVGDTNEIFLNSIASGDEVSIQKISTYSAGSDAHFSTAWSSDGRKFAVACQDGQVTVWDTRSSKPLSIFRCGKPNPSPVRQIDRQANFQNAFDRMLATAATSNSTGYPTEDPMNYRTRVEQLLRGANASTGLAREPRLEAFLRDVRSRRQSDADLDTEGMAAGIRRNENANDLGSITEGRAAVTGRPRRYTEAGTSTLSGNPTNAIARGEPITFAEFQRVTQSTIRGDVEELSDGGSGRDDEEATESPYGLPTLDERRRLLTEAQAFDGRSIQRQPRVAAARQRQSLNYALSTSESVDSAGAATSGGAITTTSRRPHAVRTFDELLTNVITRPHVHMPSSALIRSWPERQQTVVAYGEPGRGSNSWMGITERQLGESSTSGARPVVDEQRNAARALKFSPPGRTNGARDVLVFTEDTTRFHVVDTQTFNDHTIVTVPDPPEITERAPVRRRSDQDDEDEDEYETPSQSNLVGDTRMNESGDYSTMDSHPNLTAPHISGLSFDPTGGWIYVGTQRGVFEWEVERRTWGWERGYVSWA